MIPTASEVCAAARAHLGDTKVTGGQIFTDTFLTSGYYQNAYASLYRWLDRCGNKLIRRTQYFNLPANTSYLTPAGMNIANIGKPLEIFDRAIGVTFPCTVGTLNAVALGVPPSVDITTTDPTFVTPVAHGLSAGAQVITFGFGMTALTISDDVNDQWFVNVPSSTSLRLLGCAATNLGSAAGSTGIVSTGSGEFPSTPLTQVFDIDSMPLSASNGQLSSWKWQGNLFRFVPASVARQIKIVYMLSSNPPLGSTGIDDSRDALALFTAASAASAKGFRDTASNLFMRAVGNPSGDTTNIQGGAFYEMAQLGLQAINKTRIVVAPYRRKRNAGPRQFAW